MLFLLTKKLKNPPLQSLFSEAPIQTPPLLTPQVRLSKAFFATLYEYTGTAPSVGSLNARVKNWNDKLSVHIPAPRQNPYLNAQYYDSTSCGNFGRPGRLGSKVSRCDPQPSIHSPSLGRGVRLTHRTWQQKFPSKQILTLSIIRRICRFPATGNSGNTCSNGEFVLVVLEYRSFDPRECAN